MTGSRVRLPDGVSRPFQVFVNGVEQTEGGDFTIAGAWIGGYASNDVPAVLFFGAAAGAALQVVVEVGRYVARRAPGGLRSGWATGGFLAGITVMYLTGFLLG